MSKTLLAAQRYVAMIRVVIDSDSPERYRDKDVRCVAERVVSAGRLAYNLAHAKIVSVSFDRLDDADSALRERSALEAAESSNAQLTKAWYAARKERDAALAERDRLREALERIAAVEIHTGYDYVRVLASAALQGTVKL